MSIVSELPRSNAARGTVRRAIDVAGAALSAASLRTWVVAVGALALAVRLPLIATSAGTSYSGDTAEYMRFADQLLDGRFPTTYRMPGYPLFIAALGLLPGSRVAAIVTAQHVIGVALVCLILVAGWRFFGRVTGIVAALLAALTPVMLGLEHTMEPDFLFGAIVFVGACAMAEALRRPEPSLRWLAAAGAAFAGSAYVKPVGQVLPAAALLGLAVSTRSVRATARGTFVVAAVTAILLIPWVVRNEVAYGLVTLSDQGGQTLFSRMFDVDHARIPTSTADGRLIARIAVERRAREPRTELNDYARDALRARGLSDQQAVALEGRVARTAIAAEPLDYAADTGPHVWRALTDVNSFSYADVSGHENSSSLRPGHRNGLVAVGIDLWFWSVRVLAMAWWILSLSALSALLVLTLTQRRVRCAAAALIAVWVVVAVATALSHGGHRRYSAQLAPEVWIVGSAGAAIVVQRVAARVRRRPGRDDGLATTKQVDRGMG
jgi:4-amino-4-deoxy-L-arabinose transferase-like glycosyltransferase